MKTSKRESVNGIQRMASVRGSVVLRQIGNLFGLGTAAGLSEWQLVNRFAAHRDEAAFAALVARHGPMVLGVCRRVLHEPADIEDAFQATFLVLVRKASALRPSDAVGHWLYGVARRVALKARSNAARRHERERPIAAVAEPRAAEDVEVSLAELRGVIDEELGRLPATYRAAVVLCYLEGLTHEDAARQLGWPLGTVKGRLARARDLLRDRLTRRGLMTLSTAALASLLEREANASVPIRWAESAVSVAKQVSAGQATAGLVSVSAAALAEGVLWAMTIQQAKVAAVALGVLAAVAAGAGAFARQPGQGQPPAAESAATDTQAEKPGDFTTLSLPGQIVPAPSKPADTTQAVPDDAPDPVARQVFAMALERFQAGRLDVDKVYQWSKRIYDDEYPAMDNNLGGPRFPERTEVTRGHAKRMKDLEALAKSKLDTGAGESRLEFLNAQFYRRQAEKMLATAEHDENENAAYQASLNIGPAANARQQPKRDGPFALVNQTGAPRSSRRAPAAAAELAIEDPGPGAEVGKDARSQALLKKLDIALAMNFSTETPLEDVLKYIRGSTSSPDFPNGVAIYVDPIGLQEAEKSMTSTIQLDLEGVPLRRTLHLLLKQLSLCYWIQDGMIVITAVSGEDAAGSLPSPVFKQAPRAVMEQKLERGEMSAEERKAYMEMLKDESEITKLKKEIEKNQMRGGGIQ